MCNKALKNLFLAFYFFAFTRYSVQRVLCNYEETSLRVCAKNVYECILLCTRQLLSHLDIKSTKCAILINISILFANQIQLSINNCFTDAKFVKNIHRKISKIKYKHTQRHKRSTGQNIDTKSAQITDETRNRKTTTWTIFL